MDGDLDILTEGAIHHRMIRAGERVDYAVSLLAEVGLPADAVHRLPHQFSGGQRQRIGIARALSVSPDLLICDEPVAALDVSIQARILNLLLDLCHARRLTMLFISHDLSVVRRLCDRIAIMYLGRIVETAPTAEAFGTPRHPYTRALLAASPRLDSEIVKRAPVMGEPPKPGAVPPGCAFHPRCPSAEPLCAKSRPEPEPAGGNHLVSCLRWRDLPAGEVSR